MTDAAPDAPPEASGTVSHTLFVGLAMIGTMAIHCLIAVPLLLFANRRGQREVIIGERSSAKTAIAVDTIINQKDSVFVGIEQRATAVRRVIDAVRATGREAYPGDSIFLHARPVRADPAGADQDGDRRASGRGRLRRGAAQIRSRLFRPPLRPNESAARRPGRSRVPRPWAGRGRRTATPRR